ncbi:Vta1 like-domain-containing protein [Aspergillus cavernicola]|uniref:Vta1 like-domain-containing protein n=1 Tax=Aspergillus cavernicola TaxID=176166 RepID=A0ABR4I5Z3_9EURO
MASNIPAALKSADIGRFAVRAAQLEKAKPIIAYWCNFWIVNQIIEKGLHTADEEVKLYTIDLMEKLEQFKVENPDNDAILDSMAASAYVEEFGLEVFGRAEAAMRADKVTKQTADTFQAAATFLELCQTWKPLEPEFAAKVKFAKYHAVRIVKAIKAGEDPNASNPKIEEEEEQVEEALQGQLGDIESTVAPSSQAPLQPSVEDLSDESPYALPSRSPPILPQPPTTFTELPSPPQDPASASSRDVDVNDEQGSPLNLPSAPNTFASSSAAPTSLPDTPTHIGAHHRPAPSNEFQSFPPPSAIPPTSPATAPHDVSSFYNTPSAADPSRFAPPPGPGRGPSYSAHQPTPLTTPPIAAPTTSAPVNSNDLNDEVIALAQKHARWAVSALAFDDVNTAIKELRNSLRHLGAE